MQQRHRFHVGEEIEVVPFLSSPREARGRFTVLRLLPNDAVNREYRVRSTQDGHERVVRESEMKPVAGAPVG